MGISLDVGGVNVINKSQVDDRETLGMLVVSLSGPTYPKKFYNYETFRDTFDDGKVDLRKYKYIFDMGYHIAAKRVSTEKDLRGCVTITSHDKIENIYGIDYTYNPPPLGVSTNFFVDNQVRGNSGYTNHFILKLPDPNNWSQTKPYYFCLPFYDGRSGTFKQALFSKNVVLPGNVTLTPVYYYGLDINYYGSDEAKCTGYLDRDFQNKIGAFNAKWSSLNESTGFGFVTPTRYYIKKVSEREFIFYANHYVPFMKPNLSKAGFNDLENLTVTRDPFISEDFYFQLARYDGNLPSEKRIFTITSKDFDGNYGRNTSFKFECSHGYGYLNVYRRSRLVETFHYDNSLHEFIEKINSDSDYINIYTHETNTPISDTENRLLSGNLDIYEHLVNYKKDSYKEFSWDFAEYLNDFFDDDVDIDGFVYDHEIDKSIEQKLSELSRERDLLIFINYMNFGPSDYNEGNLLNTQGTFLLDGVVIPGAYLFLKEMKEYYVGDVSLNSKLRRYSPVINMENVNTVGFDGLRYYINYIHGFSNRSFLEMTRRRVHRRLYRLKETLGTTLEDIAKKTEDIITDLQYDIPVLESINLKSLKRENDTAILEIEYVFPELRPEKFELNISLNILS